MTLYQWVRSFLIPGVVSVNTFAQAEEISTLEETIVLGTRKASYTEITEDSKKLVEMPGSLGDPLSAVSTLPGVITPVGGGAPAVRGSSPADNRYYIDSMPAGYIFHQFNTSIFDENVVQDFQLFSAGFGAQYSGATGAVFDVRLRDPQHQNIETKLSASLLRAGVFIEGGITDNTAFYVSAREGLIQFFIPEDDEADENGVRIISAPEDSDYQAKFTWDINANNSLNITLAGAEDFAEAEFTEAANFVQENPDFAGDAMLNNSFNSYGATWKTLLQSGGEFKFNIANYTDEERVEIGDGYFVDSTLNDVIASGHIRFPLGSQHSITLGAEYNDYEFDYQARMVLFVCTEFDVTCQDGRGEVVEDTRKLTLVDQSVYLIDTWQATKNLNIEAGIQWNSNDYTDENFVNPRLAMEWWAWESIAITSSAGKYNRLPEVDTILPVIGNPQLNSPRAEHFTLGLKGDVGLNWNWSIDTYYKKLSELPLGLNDDQPDSENLYSNDVAGTAQGVDLFLNRNLADRWFGWISLSYSKSDRTNLRSGETRNYMLDTPVVLNVVGNYQLSEKWNAGFRLTAKSGQSTTKIIGVRENPNFPDNYLPVYDQAFDERLPYFAQIDIRFKRDIKWFNREGVFFIDVLNALNRENVISRELDYEEVNATGELHLEDEADMGIFPSVGISLTL